MSRESFPSGESAAGESQEALDRKAEQLKAQYEEERTSHERFTRGYEKLKQFGSVGDWSVSPEVTGLQIGEFSEGLDGGIGIRTEEGAFVFDRFSNQNQYEGRVLKSSMSREEWDSKGLPALKSKLAGAGFREVKRAG